MSARRMRGLTPHGVENRTRERGALEVPGVENWVKFGLQLTGHLVGQTRSSAFARVAWGNGYRQTVIEVLLI